MRGLSLVAASGGHSSSRCAGLSLPRPLLLGSTGSRCAGSVIVAHGPSCSAACGIFPDQGSNPCPLHWQADSQPLRHQGSPIVLFLLASWPCCRRAFAFAVSSAWLPVPPDTHIAPFLTFFTSTPQTLFGRITASPLCDPHNCIIFLPGTSPCLMCCLFYLFVSPVRI